ncbi:hypothetical protein C6P46_000628 [Rhodotorula mucilaginosa]|uniref:Uncharacterized protein n=1 Tax=Rhodotorula mucilaginosa TaxID=5537 RepID=A0A9P7B7U3_RHOMI|nr:hypothetical protein C6P46_000628 [Rhodotorula mucilaginosa]
MRSRAHPHSPPVSPAIPPAHACHRRPPTASHPKEREIVKKGWGTWTNFMQSYGLKAYDLDDIDEAKAILSAMAANED